ncbi:MAG: transcription elongation factor GreB [Gammaproteobacteria bacterium]|nr:transcription elongation factor GreB [Gammaproteobacteria bacterium]
MGHYRPPAPKKSPYITAKGLLALKDELEQKWKLRREVTVILSAAAAEGDRSENAEYIYRKKQLREIDYRIRYLQKRIPDLTAVDKPPSDQSMVFFGAWATLEDEQGETVRYRIVGPDEFDPKQGLISMDSPVARALMKKKIDDEVRVMTPQGEQIYCILDIEYEKSV